MLETHVVVCVPENSFQNMVVVLKTVENHISQSDNFGVFSETLVQTYIRGNAINLFI